MYFLLLSWWHLSPLSTHHTLITTTEIDTTDSISPYSKLGIGNSIHQLILSSWLRRDLYGLNWRATCGCSSGNHVNYDKDCTVMCIFPSLSRWSQSQLKLLWVSQPLVVQSTVSLVWLLLALVYSDLIPYTRGIDVPEMRIICLSNIRTEITMEDLYSEMPFQVACYKAHSICKINIEVHVPCPNSLMAAHLPYCIYIKFVTFIDPLHSPQLSPSSMLHPIRDF